MNAHNILETSDTESDNTNIIDLYNNDNNDFNNRKYKFYYKKNLYLDTFNQIEDNECPICYQSCNDTLNITTHCNHSFHKICIDEWLEKINNCPICRYEYQFIEKRIG